jgi:uncharacterized membrane protein YgcG
MERGIRAAFAPPGSVAGWAPPPGLPAASASSPWDVAPLRALPALAAAVAAARPLRATVQPAVKREGKRGGGEGSSDEGGGGGGGGGGGSSEEEEEDGAAAAAAKRRRKGGASGGGVKKENSKPGAPIATRDKLRAAAQGLDALAAGTVGHPHVAPWLSAEPRLAPRVAPRQASQSGFYWTPGEDDLLAVGLARHGLRYRAVRDAYFPSRTPAQVTARQKNLLGRLQQARSAASGGGGGGGAGAGGGAAESAGGGGGGGGAAAAAAAAAARAPTPPPPPPPLPADLATAELIRRLKDAALHSAGGVGALGASAGGAAAAPEAGAGAGGDAGADTYGRAAAAAALTPEDELGLLSRLPFPVPSDVPAAAAAPPQQPPPQPQQQQQPPPPAGGGGDGKSPPPRRPSARRPLFSS